MLNVSPGLFYETISLNTNLNPNPNLSPNYNSKGHSDHCIVSFVLDIKVTVGDTTNTSHESSHITVEDLDPLVR